MDIYLLTTCKVVSSAVVWEEMSVILKVRKSGWDMFNLIYPHYRQLDIIRKNLYKLSYISAKSWALEIQYGMRWPYMLTLKTSELLGFPKESMYHGMGRVLRYTPSALSQCVGAFSSIPKGCGSDSWSSSICKDK